MSCTVLQIKLDNRLEDDNGSICKMTVDGTDCKIYEPAPFDRKWYSHKFKGPGLRYEVGVCIQTGMIVWKNGPYPCGTWPDLKIARNRLLPKLPPNEKVLADGGYADGGVFCETPTGHRNDDQTMKQEARARHETINSRLKQFGVLSGTWRNARNHHSWAFHAVANIVQLDMAHLSPPFQVAYHDNLPDNLPRVVRIQPQPLLDPIVAPVPVPEPVPNQPPVPTNTVSDTCSTTASIDYSV
jgi:hypothetical protein